MSNGLRIGPYTGLQSSRENDLNVPMVSCRDVIEIMIPRPQVLRFEKQGIKVMTRSDWGKKKLKLLKPRITQLDTSH